MSPLNGQINEGFSIGVSYGSGTSKSKLLGIDNYYYAYDSFKIILNHKLHSKSKWHLEGIIEPGYFQVQFDDSSDKVLENQFTSINEYVLAFGVISRWMVSKTISSYVLGSIGPMYSDYSTSRMNNGIAFQNNVSIGLSLNMVGLKLNLSSGLRHVSNASLGKPNRGYNSIITEVSAIFNLQRSKPKIPSSDNYRYSFRF